MPNNFTNALSFTKHNPTFVADVTANFVVPLVTFVTGLFCTVDVNVSRVFADRYVPP